MNLFPPLHHVVGGPAGAPWLTFVPGIGNDASFWQQQAEALSDRFQVLRFDPWGHGDSPAPLADCGFQDVLDGIVQLWDGLGVERSSLVGLGFGGSVALALGLAQPLRVERIVACCCRPRQPDDRRDFWRQRRAAALGDWPALANATVDRWLNPAFRAARPEVDSLLRQMMQRTSVAGYRAYVAAFIEMDFEASLEQLRAPTLLIAAEHDHGGGPVDAMRAMAARMPGAALEVVPDVGHIVNHEAPELVSAALRRFLDEANVAGSNVSSN